MSHTKTPVSLEFLQRQQEQLLGEVRALNMTLRTSIGDLAKSQAELRYDLESMLRNELLGQREFLRVLFEEQFAQLKEEKNDQ
jgi:hypothetical protein